MEIAIKQISNRVCRIIEIPIKRNLNVFLVIVFHLYFRKHMLDSAIIDSTDYRIVLMYIFITCLNQAT